VPIIGGVLSDGFDLILTSGMLIKNSVGIAGIALLLATIVVPVIKIAVFSLLLKLTAAIAEPISDSRIPNLASSVGKLLPLLIVLILGAAFMFAITLLLVMFTANRFV
jgi:stage III sporulation protein AE